VKVVEQHPKSGFLKPAFTTKRWRGRHVGSVERLLVDIESRECAGNGYASFFAKLMHLLYK
jgi:hypothetical protein